ncbi:MAG: hypothetical protein IPM92_08075 [Saprospiraceae bacterium]|nr:hypothetical protein [Saprospiraceae bacterium]
MQIQLEPIGQQHHHLIITVEPSDYKPIVEEKLKTLRKNAHIKGFRQGAAPEGMIRKLYSEDIKAEQLQKLINKSIEDYQKENEVHFMGDLLEVPEKKVTDDQEHYQFTYEVGLAPKVETAQFINQLKAIKYQIDIDEKRIDEEVEHFRMQYADSKIVEGKVEKGDLVTLDAVELEHGMIKEYGWSSRFMIMVDDTLEESFYNHIIDKELGHSFHFNIQEVEKNLSEKDIRKYFLKIPEDQDQEIVVSNHFQGSIFEISRKHPAELNEELYIKAFGDTTDIRDEQALRDRFRADVEKYFDSESDKYLELELVKEIVDQSGLNLPDAFLKKWLQLAFEEWKGKSEHDLEHDYFHYREHMLWKLIRDAITVEQKLEINYNDVVDAVMEEMAQYYPIHQLSESMKADFVKRIIDNQEKAMKYYTSAQNKKVLQWIRNHINPTIEKISLESFREKIVHLNSHQH